MIDFGRRVALFTDKIRTALREDTLAADLPRHRAELAALEKQWADLAPVLFAYQRSQDPGEARIHASLAENRRTLEKIYLLPPTKTSSSANSKSAAPPPPPPSSSTWKASSTAPPSTASSLAPLMAASGPLYDGDTIDLLMKRAIPNGQVRRIATFRDLQDGVNIGDTVLIVDGLTEAVVIETKGWEHRGVDSPKTEQTIRGSLAAFSENLRVNTGLVRSMLRSSDLVTELIKVGARGQLNCAMMYIDSIANPVLVAEVRRRLQGIDTDYVADSGALVQFIEDSPTILFPQTLSTERPDRVAANLAEGRVALILEGNPFAQILPVSFFSFFHSAEDFSIKSGIANFLRVLRLFGALISTVLPSLYLAISYFHTEAMPTELLLAIAGSRENVPFPAWFEVLIMELSFELVREAGVRIPGLFASTIGIVGAIILGQAAVAARIVSPIVVVLVAITGLASFTIPEYRMASAIRIIRFFLFIVASTLGLFGLALVLLSLAALLCRMKSFGMPYLTPVAPRTIANYDVVLRGQVYRQELRPDAIGARDPRRQPGVSRRWTKKPPEGGEQECPTAAAAWAWPRPSASPTASPSPSSSSAPPPSSPRPPAPSVGPPPLPAASPAASSSGHSTSSPPATAATSSPSPRASSGGRPSTPSASSSSSPSSPPLASGPASLPKTPFSPPCPGPISTPSSPSTPSPPSFSSTSASRPSPAPSTSSSPSP
jgi:spore germination protein KA